MRPVNKGPSPYTALSDYKQALPYLEKRIGIYCSYCEIPIRHAPEVEHVVSKSKGGDWTSWDNLLLACKYCNTRKKDTIVPENKNQYLWPNENNTELAFNYEGVKPVVARDVLNDIDPTGNFFTKAENLYQLLQLGNVPRPGQKDRRYHERLEAHESADLSYQNWLAVKESPHEEKMLQQIIIAARSSGFFSTWMTVFRDEPKVLNGLIEAFPGTDREYFDKDGKVILKIEK